MKPENWPAIKAKLGEINIAYMRVLSDLEVLKEMAKKSHEKFSPDYSLFTKELALQNEGITVLAISKLEFLLRKLGKIKKQGQIKTLINDSNILSQLEKDWLICFFLIRHTTVHKGGYFDKKFVDNADINIKKLNLKNISVGDSSWLDPGTVSMCLRILFRFILFDLAGDVLSQNEKDVIRDSILEGSRGLR